ncbi:MAG: prepilin-type N-terminal cleavage/methylation domain-containing protein [Lachnospiraceae bacterium]
MRKENNKGFSLIEILIAMAMMAIVVLPILQTFITSARINRNARQTMIETEVAQTIMEGFADKTFLEIKSTAGAISSGTDVSGDRVPFTSINDNAFNMGSTANVPISSAATLDAALSAVSKNQIVWQGATIATSTIVSNNAISMSMNQAFANDISSNFITANATDPARKLMAVYSVGDADKILFMAFGNIEYCGYHYDAVVSFVPMARTASDLYYTYDIFLTLYEYDPNNPGERFTHALMKMEGGVMAGKEG